MARRLTIRLTMETFLAVTEMVAGHIRIREADRWSVQICRLKFHSFTSEFPEVTETQFLWAAEQWIQALPPGFTRYPTWKELMAPLYRCENGLANRSWGFKANLPPFLAPTAEQLQLLPSTRQSIAGVPDQGNAAAYEHFTATTRPLLMPSTATGLTEEQWQAYLQSLDDGTTDPQGESSQNHGERAALREMERAPVQRSRPGANSTKRRLPERTPAVH